MVHKKRPGAALSLMLIITIMSIIAGFALFNYAVREFRLEETRQVMRDIGDTVQAIHSHYTNFINIAGQYIDDYNEYAPQDMWEVVQSWGGDGFFYVPPNEETLDEITERLELDRYFTNKPFQGRTIDNVTFKTEVHSYITSPAGLSMIPSRWTVTIDVKGKGRGQFVTSLLRERAARENNFISPLHKNMYISTNIISMERNEVIVMLDCRLVSVSAISFSSFEM